MPACYNTNDLIILLDSSGSIGSGNYETAKKFVDDLARVYTAQTSSRVGFIIFSTSVSTIFTLTNTLDSPTMTSTILGTTYMSSFTNTDLGIDAAVAQFASYPPSNPLTPRNLVVITDGLSNNPTACYCCFCWHCHPRWNSNICRWSWSWNQCSGVTGYCKR